MRPTNIFTLAGLAAALALAGCGTSPGSNLVTSSVTKPQTAAAAPIDPACMTLTAQINAARQEGTPARVHAVASGKTKTAVVKRSSLAKVAELDRLNSEFQMKCSKYPGIRSAVTPSAGAARTNAPAVATASTRTVSPTIAAAVKQPVTAANKPIVAVPKQ